MNRIFTLFIFSMIMAAQVFGQQDYLVTQLNSARYSEGVLLVQDTSVYTYDTQERLMTVESTFDITQYSYEANQITIDYYSLPDLEFSRRRVQETNDDGFTILNTNYQGTLENLVISGIDSIERNEDNQITREVNYYDSYYGLEKTQEYLITYTMDGSIETTELLYYINGELYSRSLNSTIYDSEGKRERIVYTVNELFYELTYSDTTIYYYDQGALESTVKKDYSANGFSKCELVEFSQEGDSQTLVASQSPNIDCSGYVPTSQTENLYNDDILFGLESRKVFRNNELGDLILDLDIAYTQVGSLSDDDIILRSNLVSFEENLESFRSERERFYSKKGTVSIDNIKLNDNITLYPNLTEKNSSVNYKVEDIEFDSYRITDITGQAVSQEPIVDQKNLFFDAPEVSGLYFFQLFNGKIPITKPMKLVVR